MLSWLVLNKLFGGSLTYHCFVGALLSELVIAVLGAMTRSKTLNMTTAIINRENLSETVCPQEPIIPKNCPKQFSSKRLGDTTCSSGRDPFETVVVKDQFETAF